jgi:methylglutaconyl-CoA hydratase
MEAITEQGTVKSVVCDGIAEVTFFHPMSNSLPGKLLLKLADTITEMGGDTNVKVIVLKSEGEKAFCAGASFDELMQIDEAEAGTRFFSGFAHVINAIRKAPKFVLARVQGKAVGGGVGLASAADYTFAVDAASIKLSELAVGIGPFVVGPAVERKVGKSAFMQLSINATEWYSAQWAQQQGLYASVYSNTAEMDAAINKLSVQLAKSNPEAMHDLKKVFWQGTENWDTLLTERAAISGKLVVSEFTRTAIHSFKNK